MAIFSKQIFDHPYIDVGHDNDICILCRKEYMQAHKDEPNYRIDQALRGQLATKKIFKLFQNSNTPFVLCQKHIHEIDELLQEEL